LLGTGDARGLHAVAQGAAFGEQLRIEATHDIAPFFHAADIYLSASNTESFGMANLEALCAGVPAICSAVGGVPEVVGDGAWLMSNDVAVLTRALGALVANAQWREMWARRGLERAAQWPTAQTVAQEYVAIYQAA
jgi:glycosyltransferase involved in cell wall biosynthesis